MNFKIFNEAFNDENEAIVALEEFEAIIYNEGKNSHNKNFIR